MELVDRLSCCLQNEDRLARARSREIDKQIERNKHIERKIIKILLLGTGESGKSTFLKQMRIIVGDEYNKRENRVPFTGIIFGNVLNGMNCLVRARKLMHINWSDPTSEQVAAKFLERFSEYKKSRKRPLHRNNMNDSTTLADGAGGGSGTDSLPKTHRRKQSDLSLAQISLSEDGPDEQLFGEMAPLVKKLWQDSAIHRTYDRRREIQIMDSVKYFFDNLDRLSKENYVPTEQDILYSRKPTTTIVEVDYMIKNEPFRFVDVGGQRGQRSKWLQCFEGLHTILFIVSSSEFDQALVEDRAKNRLHESIEVFSAVVNNKVFSQVATILFLNKSDLLEAKIKHVSIAEYFPTFSADPRSVADVQGFILGMYISEYHNNSRFLYHHFTTATNTQNIRHIFEDVKKTIRSHNMQMIMLN